MNKSQTKSVPQTLKQALTVISIYGVIVMLLCSSLWVMYVNHYWPSVHEKLDFDLFIAEFVYQDYESIDLSEGDEWTEFTWNTFPSSVWQSNDSLKKLPVEWILNKNEFTSLDSVGFGIINRSSSKFYYMSWGAPNSRVRLDYFIYKNGLIDTLPFGGFGCGTGIYLEPIKKNEKAFAYQRNPLLFNPYSNYELELESDSFPQIIKQFYGDSVGLQFSLATYSLPWSSYEPQLIESEIIVASTNDLIENWKKQR